MKATTNKFLLCASLLFALAGRSAQAQTAYTWSNGDNSALWSDTGAWNPTGNPGLNAGDTALFDDSSTGISAATPLTLGGNYTFQSLTFSNTGTPAANQGNFTGPGNTYTIGSASDVSSSFGINVNTITQNGSGTNSIAGVVTTSGASPSVNVSAGTLNLNNLSNNIGAGTVFNVSNGGTLGALGTALGSSAPVNLTNGNLVLAGGSTTSAGLQGYYFPASPGQTPVNYGNGNSTNAWAGNFTGDTAIIATLGGLGGAPQHALVLDNPTPFDPSTTPYNGVSTANAPSYSYAGGINFPNNSNNVFAAGGVNISGTGTTGPTYTGASGGYNSITAEWTGTITNTSANPLTVTFAGNSDDYQALYINGTQVFMRGNNGTGFTNDGGSSNPLGTAAASGTNGTFALAPGASYTMNMFYDQGNGGLGSVAAYSVNGVAGITGGSGFILGNDDSTDGISFSNTVFSGVNETNPLNVIGASSVTVNAGEPSSVGVVTLNDGSNLTVGGLAPLLTFASTTLSGSTATITNSIPVEPGLITNSGSLTNLTMAGSSYLYLDNTGNSTAFNSGVTITGASGILVGVNVGGVNSLGAATLSVAGGTFSLGTDNTNNTFANPIVSTGGAITAQALGAGTTNSGQTIELSGGIALNSGTLNLNTNNTNFTIDTLPITGGGALTYNSGGNTVNLNVANPGFTGTYNANNGNTNDNVVGGLTTNSTNINNGATVNIGAQGETLGNTSVNNGYLNLNQGAINIAATTVQGSGQLTINSDQGIAGNGGAGVAPIAAIQGRVQLQSNVSSGYDLTMANNSNFGGDGGNRTFASNLSLNGGGSTIFGNNNNNFTVSGTVSGAGGLTQAGAGTTTLSGPASYTGPTAVSVGTLQLQTTLTGSSAVAVGTGANLNLDVNGSTGASPVTINGGTVNLTANGASLGTSAVSLTNASSTVVFNTGAGNTGTYNGAAINMNGGLVHVESGAANLGTAAINATTYLAPTALPGLQGYYWQGLNGAIQNATGNGAANVQNLVAGATINGITPVSIIMTAPTSVNLTGIDLRNENDIHNQFGIPSAGAVFTTEFTGHFTAPTTGTYLFANVGIDDNARVWVDTSNGTNFTGAGGVGGNNGATGLVGGTSAACCGANDGGGTAPPPASMAANGLATPVSLTAGETISIAYSGEDTGGGSTLVWGYSLPQDQVTNPTTPLTLVGPATASDGLDTNGLDSQGNPQNYWTYNTTASGGGNVQVDAGTTLTAGSIVNAQTFTMNGAVTLDSGVNATASTPIVVTVNSNAATAVADFATTLTLGANNSFTPAAMTLADSGSFATNLTLNGPGVMEIQSGNMLTVGQNNANTILAVQDGTLRVDTGSTVTGTGSITIGGGTGIAGILAGGGTVNLPVTVLNGGTIAPSDAANLTVSALTLNTGSNLSYNLSVPGQLGPTWGGSNDLVSVVSSLMLSPTSNSITVNIPTAGFGGVGTYELLSYGATSTTNVNEFVTGAVPAGYTYTFVDVPGIGSAGQFNLIVSAVPEPSTVVLFGMGLAGLWAARRRRTKRAAA